MIIEHKLKLIPLRVAFKLFSFLEIGDKLLCNSGIFISIFNIFKRPQEIFQFFCFGLVCNLVTFPPRTASFLSQFRIRHTASAKYIGTYFTQSNSRYRGIGISFCSFFKQILFSHIFSAYSENSRWKIKEQTAGPPADFFIASIITCRRRDHFRTGDDVTGSLVLDAYADIKIETQLQHLLYFRYTGIIAQQEEKVNQKKYKLNLSNYYIRKYSNFTDELFLLYIKLFVDTWTLC